MIHQSQREESPMIRDITLGQYYSADSILHRLDPRTKILATLIFIIELFLVKGFIGFAVCGAALAICVALSNFIYLAWPETDIYDFGVYLLSEYLHGRWTRDFQMEVHQNNYRGNLSCALYES